MRKFLNALTKKTHFWRNAINGRKMQTKQNASERPMNRHRYRPNLEVRQGSAKPPNLQVRSAEPRPNQFTE